MVHRESVENYAGSTPQLAEDIGNLKYDSLAAFLRLLAGKIEGDAAKDEARGRTLLAASLQDAAAQIAAAAVSIETAWQISEPHMTGSQPK